VFGSSHFTKAGVEGALGESLSSRRGSLLLEVSGEEASATLAHSAGAPPIGGDGRRRPVQNGMVALDVLQDLVQSAIHADTSHKVRAPAPLRGNSVCTAR